ncbi:uncharacterized protein BT62DRAFT_878799 [Guyanagaster necrorhizus]|uniref:DUF7702 domain-containing protein n=1 Tax=Guyanagaster necrorhizus TaxID=856835 RepID=A0A9P7W5Y9_9AGAR|nr:uncharacterized protein BT62DRAFT_878799 [Guyanagaster necrorhizus MCA 3950]KAG7453204.1 hypothetical protein BT62DRAFT_878799 [Guyanagaster necrorhizus MCA 3950]
MTIIDYAEAYGYNSSAAAIIFAIVYLFFCGFFAWRFIGAPTYVYAVLALFCAIRVTAFIIRAIMIKSAASGENLNLLIGDQVLFAVGFFGLLYAAYTLVLDRGLLSKAPPAEDRLHQLGSNRRLFRILLMVGVALGIAGITSSSDNSSSSSASALRKASLIIFLALTVVQAYLTFVLIRRELQDTVQLAGFGARHGAFILCAISLLLLVREAFLAATISNLKKETDEHFWYPLVALPEVLTVMLYCAPGLVPPRSELPN